MDLKYGIPFTKAVASGNDFIIIDDIDGCFAGKALDPVEITKDICRRRLSLGADGVLLLEGAEKGDLRMRIFNPDGSEVDMCGNGARCSVYYASQRGLGSELKMETGAGMLEAKVDGNDVMLKMSDPKDLRMDLKLGVGENLMTVHYLNTGVAHAVHLVEDLGDYDVVSVGRKIREHGHFAPEGTNANFVEPPREGVASLRTYERGVEDETLACGTGTVASAIVLGLLGMASSPVKMRTRSGEMLTVHFDLNGEEVKDVYLQGAASIVCQGRI